MNYCVTDFRRTPVRLQICSLQFALCSTAFFALFSGIAIAWSSVLLALRNIKKVGEVVERPKTLGDIRGVTYIYGMFYHFGLIDVPKEVKEKKNDRGNKKQKKGREDMLEENIKFFRRL